MSVSKTRTLTTAARGSSLISGLRHERFRLIAFETRDPRDPTSPRREASLFDSPGPWARRFFCPRFASGGVTLRRLGSPTVLIDKCQCWAYIRWPPDVLRNQTSNPASGFAQIAAPRRPRTRRVADRIAGQALVRQRAVQAPDRGAAQRCAPAGHQPAGFSQDRGRGPFGERVLRPARPLLWLAGLVPPAADQAARPGGVGLRRLPDPRFRRLLRRRFRRPHLRRAWPGAVALGAQAPSRLVGERRGDRRRALRRPDARTLGHPQHPAWRSL